jgi:hypothetical protein
MTGSNNIEIGNLPNAIIENNTVFNSVAGFQTNTLLRGTIILKNNTIYNLSGAATNIGGG